MNMRNKYLVELGGGCPLTLSVCSICALPVRTCLWPRSLECLEQHMEANRNPKMTCCGFQPVSLSITCEICRGGMHRALADGNLPGAISLRGENVADTWQILISGGNKHWGSDSHAPMWHYMVLQLFKEDERNSSQILNCPRWISRATGIHSLRLQHQGHIYHHQGGGASCW